MQARFVAAKTYIEKKKNAILVFGGVLLMGVGLPLLSSPCTTAG
jgi:hypothetical protein